MSSTEDKFYTKQEVKGLFYDLRHMFLDKKHDVYTGYVNISQFQMELKKLIGKEKIYHNDKAIGEIK